MHVNDVEHKMASFKKCDEHGVPDDITCTLSGPFTKEQHQTATKNMTVNRQKVMRALKWLMQNNHLCCGVKLPNEIDIPQPAIVDHSVTVDGLSSKVESVYETTIMFPQLNEIDQNHMGHENKEEHTREVLKDKRFFHVISQSTASPV